MTQKKVKNREGSRSSSLLKAFTPSSLTADMFCIGELKLNKPFLIINQNISTLSVRTQRNIPENIQGREQSEQTPDFHFTPLTVNMKISMIVNTGYISGAVSGYHYSLLAPDERLAWSKTLISTGLQLVQVKHDCVSP
jgi:hypothetical protein